MNKGIYRIAAGIGAAVILVSSCTVQASMVTTNGTPAAVATDSIANWPTAPAVTSETAVLMDADLQHPPRLIPEMLKYIEEGYDSVATKRTSRIGETKFRKYFSKKFFKFINGLRTELCSIEVVTT